MHKCKICGKEFEKGKQLGGHMVSHQKVKCEICGKEFSKLSIKRHLKFHEKDSECLFCGKAITGGKKFCNHSCSAKFNNKGIRRHGMNSECRYCQKEIDTRKQYCNYECMTKYRQKTYIDKWLRKEVSGNKVTGVSNYVRSWLFDRANNKCEECGWNKVNATTGKIPLNTHHKDGNSKNTTPENLQLLCPSCHSLTPTYGSLNNGNGREYRYSKNGG